MAARKSERMWGHKLSPSVKIDVMPAMERAKKQSLPRQIKGKNNRERGVSSKEMLKKMAGKIFRKANRKKRKNKPTFGKIIAAVQKSISFLIKKKAGH